jgi:hypothetical protein
MQPTNQPTNTYVLPVVLLTYGSLLLCARVCTRLASSGIELTSASSPPVTPRDNDSAPTRPIYLPEAAWQHCVTGLGYLILQPNSNANAIRAARVLRDRAQAELDAPLLLSTNALLHASKFITKP